MNLWTELAILAMRPGGWILPVLGLFCFFLAWWAVLIALFERERDKRTPPSFTGGRVIDIAHSQRTHAAYHRPKTLQAGPRRVGGSSTRQLKGRNT